MNAEHQPIIICSTIAEMHAHIARAREAGDTIGCVPTMGYLHEGHASLIRAAAQKHRFVVASIFVNPTQFGPSEDFERYPRDLERDLAVLQGAGATHLFLPDVQEMYPDGIRSTIHLSGVTEVLEGAFRPTHFDGVATVVARLFQAMLPDEAFFGQKDLQQTLVIKQLVQTSSDPAVHTTRVTVMPTIREADGLAKSSRNVYLNADDRRDAVVIYKALESARSAILSGHVSCEAAERLMRETLSTVPRLQIDYAAAVDAETLRTESGRMPNEIALCIAAKLGNTRLIDNMLVQITPA
jgi:pantoate--beta-alanine ligase